MLIETKYDTGDKVWVMHNNRATKATIDGVFYNHFISSVTCNKEQPEIVETYTVEFDSGCVETHLLKEIFDSREELINSL